jgi:hypothetical protein
MVGGANNQAHAPGPTHERKHICMIYERTSRKQTLTCVSDPPKKPTIGDKTKPLGSQKVGLENKQPRVTWLGYLVMPSKMEKCKFQHVLLHLEE